MKLEEKQIASNLHVVRGVGVIPLGRHDPQLESAAIVRLVLPCPVAHIVGQARDEQVAEGVLGRRVVVDVAEAAEELDGVVCNVARRTVAPLVANGEIGKVIQEEV